MVIKILVLFGTMFLLMMIGSPIAVALGVATMVTMTATTNISLTTMSTACLSGLDSFPLMAIPFFMLAGNLMKSGGISRRILDFADAVVGWVTGSVGMVTVVASMFFAALSGSSPATVTAIGGITIPEMKEEGYDPAYATAITAAAGTIGVIIPPSIPFVIYGVAAQCSISDLFLAGIIPGILIGVVLMIVNYVTAKKHGFGHTKKFHAGHLLRTLGDSIWALLVPVIILGGIYGGIFTPTESAVAAILYSIFVGVFIYHELDLKSILEAFKETADSLTEIFKKALNNDKLTIQVEKLKNENIASMITVSEESRRMQDMMKMYNMYGMDPGMFGPQETLVLNANHKLVQHILANKDGAHIQEICEQLYDLASLSHGSLTPERMTRFIARSNELMGLLAE